MASIRPFAAIRPAAEYAARIAALPYDVYNRKEAKERTAQEPMSFLRIDRPETNFPDDHDMYAPEVYQKAHDILYDMVEKGNYIKEETPVYYIYELCMNGRRQTGIVACASIDDYLNNVIRKHENTREEKEIDRIRHVDACNAQTGPIFLAYRSRPAVNEIVDRIKQDTPLYDFTSEDGIGHSVWIIREEPDISRINEEFRNTAHIYIADGHHRAASAVKVGIKRRKEHPGYSGEEAFNYFLSVLFPDDQLSILPYNRVVRDLNGLSEQEFLEKLAACCEIEKKDSPYQPVEKGTFGMYLAGQWYCLRSPSEWKVEDPVAGLDVSILQDHILEPILGIKDPRTDERIDFVGGIRGLSELERRCLSDMKAAFSMYPTSIQELFEVADHGLLMPPKSTWFEPKLRSGIFIHQI